ncbi:hypothetical protein Lal_00039947, partial [Lupinus albus]
MVQNNNIVGVDTPITFNIRSQISGLVRVEKEKKCIELKIFSGDIFFPRGIGIKKIKIWIYVQWITTTKKKCFVLVRPTIRYEIADGTNLVKTFPQDFFQERDILEQKVLNYILCGNGKSIREISNTSIQL